MPIRQSTVIRPGLRLSTSQKKAQVPVAAGAAGQLAFIALPYPTGVLKPVSAKAGSELREEGYNFGFLSGRSAPRDAFSDGSTLASVEEDEAVLRLASLASFALWRPQITESVPVWTMHGAMYPLAPIFGWPCENQLQWTLPTAGTLKVRVFLSSTRRLLG